VSSYVSTHLRQFAVERANYCCEYCLLPQSVSLHKHEPDHIVPSQHGGITKADNLALACMRCNRYKGPNVGSFDPLTGKLVPFFNPLISCFGNFAARISRNEDRYAKPLTSL